MRTDVRCPYCGREPEMVSGDVIYPHRTDLHAMTFFRCAPCGAHVGCHPGTITPLGRLANAELRLAKQRAHAAFDPLWQYGGPMTRRKAYQWLQRALGLSASECHIGMFDVAQCRRVVDVVNELLKRGSVDEHAERTA